MKILLLITYLTFSSALVTCLAQDSNLGIAQQANNKLTSRSKMNYDEQTAYLSKDWNTGRVFFLDGKSEDLIINYNAYNQVLEQQKTGEKLTFDKPVKSFILGGVTPESGHVFVRGFQPVDQQGVESFYQVLHETPNFKLLKFPQFKTRSKREFNDANTTVIFDLYESYYLGYTTGQLQKLKNSKKQATQLFPQFSKEITEYIQKNDLKFKDWNDMAAVLDYVETLL